MTCSPLGLCAPGLERTACAAFRGVARRSIPRLDLASLNIVGTVQALTATAVPRTCQHHPVLSVPRELALLTSVVFVSRIILSA